MSRVRLGFTLLEALVALVLVAGVVVATLAAVGGSMRSASAVGAHARAVTLADLRMNELVLAAADSISYYARPRAGSFAAPFDGYRWQARLVRRRWSPGLIGARVVVSWQGGEYGLETEVFRNELLPGARWRAR